MPHFKYKYLIYAQKSLEGAEKGHENVCLIRIVLLCFLLSCTGRILRALVVSERRAYIGPEVPAIKVRVLAYMLHRIGRAALLSGLLMFMQSQLLPEIGLRGESASEETCILQEWNAKHELVLRGVLWYDCGSLPQSYVHGIFTIIKSK